MLEVLNSSAPYLLTIAAVKLLSNLGYISKSMKPAASELVGKIALPLIIFGTLLKINFTIDDFDLFLLGLVLVFVLQGTIYGLTKLFKIEKSKQMAMVLSFGSLSLGTVVYPLALLNFGDAVFQKVVLFDSIGWFIVFLTFSQFFAQIKSDEEHSFSESLKKIATSPSVLAIVFGLGLNLLNLTPSLLQNTVDFSSKSFGFLAALMVGLNLSLPRLKTVFFIAIAFFARMIFVVLIAVVASYFLHFDKNTETAVLLSMFSPASVMGLIFTGQYGFDEKYYTQVLAISTIISLFMLPIAATYLKANI